MPLTLSTSVRLLTAFVIVVAAPQAVSAQTVVPVLAGSDQPDTLGPARDGGVGVPQARVTLQVRMVIPSACAISIVASAPEPAVICSHPIGYHTGVTRDSAGVRRLTIEY